MKPFVKSPQGVIQMYEVFTFIMNRTGLPEVCENTLQ